MRLKLEQMLHMYSGLVEVGIFFVWIFEGLFFSNELFRERDSLTRSFYQW